MVISLEEPDYIEMLILGLRARWDPTVLSLLRDRLARSDVDWAVFERLAKREGVAPLVYAALRGQSVLPRTVEVALRAYYVRQATQNLLLFRDLAAVLRAFESAGLRVLVLKGAALVATIYGNLALRPMCDLDLLLDRETVPDALAVLHDLGYASDDRGPWSGDTLTYENELMLHRRRGSLSTLLEIHWGLFDSFHYQHVASTEWFWNTSRSVEIEGVETKVLGIEAQVLHLCGHLLLHHGSESGLHLLWLHDIAEVVVNNAGEVDWLAMINQARAHDLLLPIQRILPEVRERWCVPIPAEAVAYLAQLQPSPAEIRVVDLMAMAKRSVLHHFLADLIELGSWRARVRYALHNLFPSPIYMKKRYRISSLWLIPLYYPYRWFIGLRGWILRSFHRRETPN